MYIYEIPATWKRFKFLEITNLKHFFMYLLILCLYIFRASQRSSARDRIVLILRINTSSDMISLCKCLLDMPVRSSLLTDIPSSHSPRLIIPDDVLIQFDFLMMSAVTLETCRHMK